MFIAFSMYFDMYCYTFDEIGLFTNGLLTITRF